MPGLQGLVQEKPKGGILMTNDREMRELLVQVMVFLVFGVILSVVFFFGAWWGYTFTPVCQ